MRRDMDLVRNILLWIEAQDHALNINWEIQIEGFSDEQVGYHCHLMHEAGLIVASDATCMDSQSPEAIPRCLTWAGHDFLDSVKDATLWAKAKKHVILPAGGVAFSVLTEWVKAEAKHRLHLV
ncbi:MAG: hypothetical protein JWL97_4329 [Gemmatimonadales bacterium]|nr:hypothetical protein [Gemmatimonadales bacterium]